MQPHAPKNPPAPLKITWYGRTDRGKVRLNNEDAFLGLQFDSKEVHRLGKTGEGSTEKMDYAFAVSDGMGGAMAGEYASRIAVEKITTLLPRSFQQSAIGLEAGFSDVLTELFDKIHRQDYSRMDVLRPHRGQPNLLSAGVGWGHSAVE